MNKSKSFPIVLALFILAALSGCSFSLSQDVTPPPGYTPPQASDALGVIEGAYPLTTPDAAQGEQIFADRCAACHGDLGLGDGPQAGQLPVSPAAIGSYALAAQRSPAQWYAMITNGRLESFMPPFSNALSDSQRWDVVAYVYSLNMDASLIDGGAAVYAAECKDCHGADGRGGGPLTSDFTNQARMVTLSDQDLATVTLNGDGGEMPAYAGELSDEELLALIRYVRAFSIEPYFGGESALSAGQEPTAAPADGGSAAGPSDGEGQGIVRGVVTNGSGGIVPRGLEVTLFGYDQTTEIVQQESRTGANGSFEFTDVALAPSRVFFVSVEYKDQVYGSEIVVVSDESTEYELPVTVYETTTDGSNLVVSRMHVFLEFPEPDLMQVVELAIVQNPGQEVVISGGTGLPAVTFSLPEGAENLVFQDGRLGERFISTGDGFGDTLGILPGDEGHEVLFAFSLPYTRRLDFRQVVDLGAEVMIVFVPEGSVTLSSDQLSDAGVQELGGLRYQVYFVENLPAEAALEMEVRGRHPLSGGFSITRETSSLVLGALGLSLTLAGIFMWMREAKKSRDSESAESVMDAIIALDDAYERGKLNEREYRRQRARNKTRLAELMKK